MNQDSNRSRIVIGTLLILGGGFWLASTVFPPLRALVGQFTWPMIMIAIGGALLVGGVLGGTPGMAVPACIVGGIGMILFWQNQTGNFGSWAYAWTLIPGFAGVGEVLAALLGDRNTAHIRSGLRQIVVSAVLFVVFGSFLGGFRVLGPYWPVILIAGGLLLILDTLFFKK